MMGFGFVCDEGITCLGWVAITNTIAVFISIALGFFIGKGTKKEKD